MLNNDIVSFSMIKEMLKHKKVRPLFFKYLCIAIVIIGTTSSLIALYPPAALFIIGGSIMTLFVTLSVVTIFS